MGEEKPDEELMGKRKSSPRLSTTFDDVDNLRIARLRRFIHPFLKKEFSRYGDKENRFIFQHGGKCGTMRKTSTEVDSSGVIDCD
ncbi:single-stranded DNA-binding protein [Paenibacillus guangzhouensis]|uniref:single-stranded DNA-binding protein n=1 Tax=Paenibacillus guangzhouensis TaxID=1473112 RepID=UPI001266E0E9|nr:single-stranded DNA-binding protein [Paenibacillus guangzhouensis]